MRQHRKRGPENPPVSESPARAGRAVKSRDAPNIAVKISNKSKEMNTAFILLFGEPLADT
jgi:hypothetical protein